MSLRLSRPVDTLLRHADADLMDLVDALGVEGTNLGEALEDVRRMLAQAAREYSADTCLRDFLAEKGSEGR